MYVLPTTSSLLPRLLALQCGSDHRGNLEPLLSSAFPCLRFLLMLLRQPGFLDPFDWIFGSSFWLQKPKIKPKGLKEAGAFAQK